MTRSPNKLIPSDFTPTPSLGTTVDVTAVDALDAGSLDAIAVLVSAGGDLPSGVDLDRAALKAVGFEAKPGTSLLLPQPGAAALVLVGIGDAAELDVARLRDAAATAARATATFAGRLGLRVPSAT